MAGRDSLGRVVQARESLQRQKNWSLRKAQQTQWTWSLGSFTAEQAGLGRPGEGSDGGVLHDITDQRMT